VEAGRLVAIQRLIESRVIRSIEEAKPITRPRLFVGLDAAYSRKYGGVGAAVIVSEDCSMSKYSLALGQPDIPYIPGLLAFREAPILYAALYPLLPSIRGASAVLFVDGHGVSHPRHTGIASHMGLALSMPSVGVAKKRLYGREHPFASTCTVPPCVDGYLLEDGRRIAAIIRTKTGSKIYVSPGAYISLDDAVRLSLACLGPRRLPAPTYYADRLSKRVARGLDRGELSPTHLQGRLRDYLG